MNWLFWGTEMQRYNADLLAYSPTQLSEMRRDRVNRTMGRFTELEARRTRKTSIMRANVRYALVSFLIIAAMLTVATLCYAVAVRRMALDNAYYSSDLLTSELQRSANSDADDREGQYFHFLNMTLNESFDFNSQANADSGMLEPQEITGEYYAAAYENGEKIAESQSYMEITQMTTASDWRYILVPLPDDFSEEDFYKRLGIYNIQSCRLKGRFENGHTFQMTEMEISYSTGDGAYSSSGSWTAYIRDDTSDDEGFSYITYRGNPYFYFYDSGSPITADGVKYENLVSFTDANLDNLENAAHYGLWQMIYTGRVSVPSLSGGKATVVFVGRCSPVQTAMKTLVPVYVLAFIMWGLVTLSHLGNTKRALAMPLAQITDAMGGEWEPLYPPEETPAMYVDVAALYERYTTACDRRRFYENEITRLNTALDYAKEAEENRRTMVSNIAHELKTPLAVVHGYAEGLRDHIAEEKREHYLDTILSETERMDGMVHDMLDLSRLEAGKVKLARDEFSLTELTQSIFDRLSPLIEEKGLQLSVEADGDCTVIADEARVGQVVTNFAANAVKYTPESGVIRVKIEKDAGGKTRFSIENTAVHFTEEELAKVWDTFYRGDKSRHSDGTGLGLAIAKNIVELHGGTVSVRNTDCGVEFGFTI